MSLARRTLGVLAILPLGAAQSSPDWREQPVPSLKSSKGDTLAVSGTFGWLAEQPQSLQLGEEGKTKGAPLIAMRDCVRKLDVTSILAAGTQVLRKRGYQIAYSSGSGNQAILFSQPVLGYDRRYSFYSLIAEREPCGQTCRLTVATYRVSAPKKDNVLLLSEARRSDDDITGLLLDASDEIFSRCQPL